MYFPTSIYGRYFITVNLVLQFEDFDDSVKSIFLLCLFSLTGHFESLEFSIHWHCRIFFNDLTSDIFMCTWQVLILCNDCNTNGRAFFHIFGHKCGHCNSYNTRVIMNGENRQWVKQNHNHRWFKQKQSNVKWVLVLNRLRNVAYYGLSITFLMIWLNDFLNRNCGVHFCLQIV